MQINLSELFGVDGKEKTYITEIEMTEFEAPDGVYEIIDKEPVVLRIRNLGERKLLMEGKARLTLQIPCDRCLEPVSCPFELDIAEELDMNPKEDVWLEELEEQPYVSGHNLDVDQLLQCELIPDLPMKVLCGEDCQGICNKCGMNLNHEHCNCDQSVPDPRMAGIQDLFTQFHQE